MSSDFVKPTCNAGICEAPVCDPPAAGAGAIDVTTNGHASNSAQGATPSLTNISASPPDVQVHACGRLDFSCVRRTCGWQSPGVTGQGTTNDPPLGTATPFKVPVVPPALAPPGTNFQGYLAVVPGPGQEFLPVALFSSPPYTGTNLGSFVLAGKGAFNDFAKGVQVTLIADTGIVGVSVVELLPGATQPSLAVGATVDLDDNSGIPVPELIKNRVYLDQFGGLGQSDKGVQGQFTVFLNVPETSYIVAAHKTENGVEFAATAPILALSGVTSDITLFLEPTDAGAATGH